MVIRKSIKSLEKRGFPDAHPKRRQHDKIVFMPDSEQIVDGNYNLWRGFAFKPKEFDLGLPLAETKFSEWDRL